MRVENVTIVGWSSHAAIASYATTASSILPASPSARRNLLHAGTPPCPGSVCLLPLLLLLLLPLLLLLLLLLLPLLLLLFLPLLL